MNQQKKHLKDILAVLAIAAIALFMEFVVFQWNACIHPKYTSELQIADAVTKEFDMQTEEETVSYTSFTFRIKEQYVRYLYLTSDSEQNLSSTIDIAGYDGYHNEKALSLTDTLSSRLGRSAVQVECVADQICITVPTEQVKDIQSVEIANKLVLFPARLFLLFFGGLFAYLFFAHGSFFAKRPEWMYAIASVILGVTVILSAHHALDSWDEQIHFYVAYTESWPGSYLEFTGAAMGNAELSVPTGDTVEEEQWIGQWLNEFHHEVVLTSEKTPIFIRYGQRAYIPQIFGLFLGRVLHLPYTVMIFLGKLFNLLFCTGVVACAIHFSKYGKRALMCVGLLPTTIFLFSSFTYDSFVIALLMLGMALFVTEYLEKGTLNGKRIFVSVLAFVVGCFSKAVYIPLLAIYWMLPKDKFYSKRQKNLFRIAIAVLIILMFASFVMPLVTSAASGVEVSGDYRGGDTSQTSQLSMILGYPLTYTWVLLSSIGKTLGSYFVGAEVLANFAYRGIYRGLGYLILMLTMLFTFLTDYGMSADKETLEQNRSLLGVKLWDAFLIFGAACLVWTALYLDFTPVGAEYISGVSPRYYLPLIFPFGILFMNKKIKCNCSTENYQRTICLLMLVGTGLAIFNQMLL